MRQRIMLDSPRSAPAHMNKSTKPFPDTDTAKDPEKESLYDLSGGQSSFDMQESQSPENPSEKAHNKGSTLKVNSGFGVLRYALHLRFLCCASKKGLKVMRRCKSDLLSAPDEQPNLDRRFYLYSNLKVVFPQRHTDSDEGKVKEDISLSGCPIL